MTTDRLIGLPIEYEFTKSELRKGTIMAQIDMLHQDQKNQGNASIVTGYMIMDEITKVITPITYWRIKKAQ